METYTMGLDESSKNTNTHTPKVGKTLKLKSPSKNTGVIPTPPSKRRRGRPRILKDYVDPMKSPMANTSMKVQKQGYQEAKPFMKIVNTTNNNTITTTTTNTTTNTTTINNYNTNTTASSSINNPSFSNLSGATLYHSEEQLKFSAGSRKNMGENMVLTSADGVISRRSSITTMSPFTTPQRFNYYMNANTDITALNSVGSSGRNRSGSLNNNNNNNNNNNSNSSILINSNIASTVNNLDNIMTTPDDHNLHKTNSPKKLKKPSPSKISKNSKSRNSSPMKMSNHMIRFKSSDFTSPVRTATTTKSTNSSGSGGSGGSSSSSSNSSSNNGVYTYNSNTSDDITTPGPNSSTRINGKQLKSYSYSNSNLQRSNSKKTTKKQMTLPNISESLDSVESRKDYSPASAINFTTSASKLKRLNTKVNSHTGMNDSNTTSNVHMGQDLQFNFKLKIDPKGKAFITSPLETKFSDHHGQHGNLNTGAYTSSLPSKSISNRSVSTMSSKSSSINSSSDSLLHGSEINIHNHSMNTLSNNNKYDTSFNQNNNNRNISGILHSPMESSLTSVTISASDDIAGISEETPLKGSKKFTNSTPLINSTKKSTDKQKILSLMNQMKKKKPKTSNVTSLEKGATDYQINLTNSSSSSSSGSGALPSKQSAEPTVVFDETLDINDQTLSLKTPEKKRVEALSTQAKQQLVEKDDNLMTESIDPDITEQRAITPPPTSGIGSPKSLTQKLHELTKTPIFYKDWHSANSLLMSGSKVNTAKSMDILRATTGSTNNNIQHNDDEDYKKFLNSSPMANGSNLNHPPSNMISLNLDNLLASPTTNSLLTAFSQAVHSSPLAMNRLRSTPQYPSNAAFGQQRHIPNILDLQMIDHQIKNNKFDLDNISLNNTISKQDPESNSLIGSPTSNVRASENLRANNETGAALYDVEFMSQSHLKKPW